MPSRRTLSLALLLAVATLLTASAAFPAGLSFRKTLLGTFGGPFSEVASGGLNNAGQAVGESDNPSGLSRPFLWSAAGGMVDLGPGESGWEGVAMRVNEAGEVSGNLWYLYGFTTVRGFYWSPDAGRVDISVDPAWNSSTSAMNNFGAVTLAAGQGPSGFMIWQDPHPYVWTLTGGFTPLAPEVGEPLGWARGINDAGQVVGASFSTPSPTGIIPPARPFRYTPGVGVERFPRFDGVESGEIHEINRRGDALVTLDRVLNNNPSTRDYSALYWAADGTVTDMVGKAGSRSEARYLNNRGEACGRTVIGGKTHAFYWSPETGMVDIGASFPYDSDADGMNNLGHVVGYHLAVENEWDSLRGYFWSKETGVVDLGPGRAWAINDSDLLGGYSNNGDGTYQAAVWTRGAGPSDPPPADPCSIDWLKSRVAALSHAAVLKTGAARSLTAKLNAAGALQAKGKEKAADKTLAAFTKEVRALVKTRRLPAADGDALTACSSKPCHHPERDGKDRKGKH
ncbi:MAG: hypothetical protein WC899_08485 [bacterium]|jgi:probable HAF family extracellular repeat protein